MSNPYEQQGQSPQYGPPPPAPRGSAKPILIGLGIAVAILLAGGTAVVMTVGSGPEVESSAVAASSAPANEQAASGQAAPSPTPTLYSHQVTFEGESRDGAAKLGTVSYSAKRPSKLIMGGDEKGVELPYRYTVQFGIPLPELTLWVMSRGVRAEMVCRIRVDGRLVVENSGSGPMGALCTLSQDEL